MNKRIFTTAVCLCCLVAAALLCLPNIAHAATWTSSDFVIEGNTVYGLSDSGVAKAREAGGAIELPTADQNGAPVTKVGSFAFTPHKTQAIKDYTGRADVGGRIDNKDVDGNEIRPIGADFDANLLTSVTIPEGYTTIGQDAFDFNGSLAQVTLGSTITYMSDYAFAHTILTSITLPSSLERLGDQVFFDSRIGGELTLPTALKTMGERVFKGNSITSVNFNNCPLDELKECVFEDNRIAATKISENITKIAPDAFNGNVGDENYGDFVVLTTPEGNNPHHLPDQGNYYVDPSDDKRTTPLDIDYSTYTEEDFTYENDTVTGFSVQGERKVKKNKHLVIPAQHNGVTITKIGDNAFRNVELDGNQLKKYDIEKLTLPPTITSIGAFAFQSNALEDLLFDPDNPLTYIGNGAFMNNRISMLSLPPSVSHIGDAAFHINRIEFALIPRDTVYLGRSAFRQNNLIYGMGFEEGAVLEEVGEMAFAQSSLSSADLSNATKLKTIDVQAFAGNTLSSVTLPSSLTHIEAEAFRSNKLTKVDAPKTLQEIVFNAFDDNPGMEEYHNRVLIDLPDDMMEHTLADGDNFVIEPRIVAPQDGKVSKMIAELEQVGTEDLRPETKHIIEELIKEGKEIEAKPAPTQGEVNRYLFRASFFLNRVDLDRAIQAADNALNGEGKETDKKLLEEKNNYAKRHFANAAWSSQRVARITHELHLLTDLVNNTGAMSKATMVQGVHHLKTTLPIPAYYIGVNTYINPDGTILYVLDRSYAIGEGSLDEWGNPVANVDEDNEGYHELALDTLADYEGLKAIDIYNHPNAPLDVIRLIENAPEHRAGIYFAVLDAVTDYLAAHNGGEGDDSGSTPNTPGDNSGNTPNIPDDSSDNSLPDVGGSASIDDGITTNSPSKPLHLKPSPSLAVGQIGKVGRIPLTNDEFEYIAGLVAIAGIVLLSGAWRTFKN